MADQNGYIDHEDQDRQNKTQNDFTDRDLPAAHDPHGKDVDDLFAVDHPLDLSFTKDKNYGNRAGAMGGYASDNDKPRVLTKQSIDELSGSISISDGSIVAKMQQIKKPDDDYSLQGSGAKQNRSMTGRVKRILTSDMKGDRSKMNDSQSTFLGNNPSFRQQIDCLSNLQHNRYDRQSTRKRRSITPMSLNYDDKLRLKSPTNAQRDGKNATLTTAANNGERTIQIAPGDQQTINNRKEKLQIYNEIDREWFNPDKPTNPMLFIDNEKQKVIINPGVPYISTSQNEIFERRIQLNKKEHLNKINPFIAAPEEEGEKSIYEGKKEESYIQCMYDPYQLKTTYLVKKVEEIEFDSDDEDAIILAQQPYETVMQTGFKDYLNHLNTKFLARRSDIIVSSTLSVTLTPEDDGFRPTHFAEIEDFEIWEYVMKRQEYRALKIQSNAIKS